MKISKKLVDLTLKTGLPPIDTCFFPCKDKEGQTVAYYAMQILNTVEFGVLTPSDFRVVAGRTNQCVRLADKALDKVFLELRRREVTVGDYEYIMVEAPRQMLEDGSLVKNLEEHLGSGDFSVRNSLCILFGAEILLTDPAVTVPKLDELRRLGIRIGVTDFGDESTSTLRLVHFPFEVVVLEPSVAKTLLQESNLPALGAVVTFAESLGMKVFMNGALNDGSRALAFSAGVTATFEASLKSTEEVMTDNG